MGWPPDETIVLHAGAMGLKQGLENVVDAAALADEQNRPIRFVLLGDGSQRRSLEDRAKGVAKLTFMTLVDDSTFKRALGAADVLLVNERPGLSEMAVPSKLTAYMTSGRPVLAATEPGSATAEQLRRSAGGVRIDPGHPGELLSEALRLAGDRDLATEMGRNGQQFCREQLSEVDALQGFESWLADLMASRSDRHDG